MNTFFCPFYILVICWCVPLIIVLHVPKSSIVTSSPVSHTQRQVQHIGESVNPKGELALRVRDLPPFLRFNKKGEIPWGVSDFDPRLLYLLESRWRNSHVLVYHGHLLSHLLGVAPSTFTTVYMKLFCFAMVFFGLRLTPKARTVPGTLMKFS